MNKFESEPGKVFGERKPYKDIKRKCKVFYVWAKCPNCGEGRWVREQYVNEDFTSTSRCRSCFYEYNKRLRIVRNEATAKNYFCSLDNQGQKEFLQWCLSNRSPAHS